MEAENYVPKPESYLVLAIICTVCCCLPLGIVAIVKAAKVDDLYRIKQYEAAEVASNDAKRWSIIGMILGAIGYGLYIVLAIFTAMASM